MASTCLVLACALLCTLATASAVAPHSGNLAYLAGVPQLPHLAKTGDRHTQHNLAPATCTRCFDLHRLLTATFTAWHDRDMRLFCFGSMTLQSQ